MKNSIVIKKAWKNFLYKFLTSAVVRGAVLIIPLILSKVVDLVTTEAYEKAIKYSIWLLVTLLVLRLTEILNTYAWHKFYNKIYNEYTDLALNKTFNNSIFSLSRFSLSEYINIMNNDINVLANFFCNLPIRLFRVFELSIILIYFFKIHLYVGISGLIATGLAFTIIFLSAKKLEEKSRTRTLSLDKKTSVMHELLLSIKEVKSFNIFQPIRKRILEKTDIYTNDLLKQRVTEDSFRATNLIVIEIFRIVLVIYGIHLVAIGEAQIGILLIIYNYFGQLVDNAADLSAINNELRNLIVSHNRYNKLWTYSKEEEESSFLNKDIKGSVQFKNILYGYKNNPMLNKVSFEIPEKALTTIAGSSSNNKSGIFDLLLKLNRQHEGEILIDNININDFSDNEYYYLISSVLKDVIFFNMSIKENLTIIEPDFEKIIKVCKQLNIHNYIINLKDGYDTEINNNADTIDSNIKYMLGIARAILKKPKILLLNETLNSLEGSIKKEVIKLLLKLKKEITIIIISNDLEILKKSDNIILLDNNIVKNMGKHDKLIKQERSYNSLFN